jgi:EmrB/QacA subfamily drug resistance transporter
MPRTLEQENDKDAALTNTLPAVSPPRPIRLVFPALLLVLLLASLDQTIVSTALPTIAGEFGGLEHLSWIVTAYLLATTAVSPIYGKLGDLYGRKVVLQAAIGLFLLGSVLCGLSRDMGELIAFRAIQGLGGGGLIVTTMAAIGDIIPPRDRGRYQGYFGAVFGVSTVIGPLIGGFFVQHLSWRWIFYVNLPLGILAFLALAWAFPRTKQGKRPDIDYPGALLLAATLTGIVLFTSLGGTVLPWLSAGTIGLAALSLAGLAAFLFVEHRAQAPILPLDLFRNPVFAISSLVGFIVGLSMFGAVTYLPLYLQVVKGADPSAAGLQITPMMAGVLVSSIVSGQIISRIGRYKIFPVAGTAVMALGLLLLSTLDVDTSTLAASGYMLVLGLGLGMVMQVLVLAVQNAVSYEYLGVATSGAMLFRSVGGSIGVSLFGALFASGLSGRLAATAGAAMPAVLNPTAIRSLPQAARDAYLHAFADALQPVFIIAAVLAAVAFLVSFFLQDIPLKRAARTSDIGDSFAMQRDPTSVAEAERIVTELADRENRARWYERLAQELKIDLRPDEIWLLGRVAGLHQAELHQAGSREAIADAQRADPNAVRHGIQALAAAGYVVDTDGDLPRLTDVGRELYSRIVAYGRRELAGFASAWAPEKHAELDELLTRLARAFVSEPPARPALARQKPITP